MASGYGLFGSNGRCFEMYKVLNENCIDLSLFFPPTIQKCFFFLGKAFSACQYREPNYLHCQDYKDDYLECLGRWNEVNIQEKK